MRADLTDRALWALWGLFWALMIAVAIEDAGPGHRWWEPCLWEGSSCLVGSLWFLAERRAAARWREDLTRPARWFGRHLAWWPVVAATFITSIYALRHGVYALVGMTYPHRAWTDLIVYESIKLVLYQALWLSVIFGLESFALWQRERERLLTLQKHLAESRLAQLRAQLQPHFLFNALNTISSLMQVDVARADRLLARLADLLRGSLRADSVPTTSLREELGLLRLYADIMCERFVDRVTLAWNVDEGALAGAVPTMLLQPLLENAFKHGAAQPAVRVAIRIEARRQGDHLRIALHNTGTLVENGQGGIGLANCRERLRVMYGGTASLALAQEGTDVTVRLALPWSETAP